MTIRKGEEWGQELRVDAVLTVFRDSDLSDTVHLAQRTASHIQVQGGDTWMALGQPASVSVPGHAWQLPCDALEVTVNEQKMMTYSTVVMRRPWWAGGALSGAVWCTSLSGIIRGRNITPRAHANDGAFDVLHVNENMKVRQRLQAWSRSRSGDHLPHRDIEVTRVREVTISSPRRMVLVVDGKRRGTSHDLHIRILPNEWSVVIPARMQIASPEQTA